MNAVILPIVLSVSFIGEVSAPAPVADDDTRRIRFHVHVEDFRGTPLEQVPLGVFDGAETRVDGATDENGNVLLEASLPTAITRVEIKPAFARESSFTSAEQTELVKRMATWSRNYAAERCYVYVEADRDDYRVDFVYLEPVTVRGIVVGENEEPVGNIVYARDAGMADARGRREFVLAQVRKASDTTLLATRQRADGVSAILAIRLTKEQTQTDVNLGLIVIPEIQPDTLLDVHLDNIEVLRNASAGVTFIRADGRMLFAAPAYDIRHERAGQLSDNPIGLPAGEYYVAPGNADILPQDEVWSLVEALREGRDVEPLDIHKITLHKGERQTFNFDIVQIQQSIRKLMQEE